MKQTTKIILFTLALVLFSCCPAISAEKQHQMDILFMNHGPMRPTIAKIRTLLTEYPHVQAAWHDFDTDSGKRFMKQEKLQGHIPLLIMLNRQSSFNLDKRDILLKGFPTGASPFKQVEGNWSIDDLKRILDNLKE